MMKIVIFRIFYYLSFFFITTNRQQIAEMFINYWMPGGNKKVTHTWTCSFRLIYVTFLLLPGLKGLTLDYLFEVM